MKKTLFLIIFLFIAHYSFSQEYQIAKADKESNLGNTKTAIEMYLIALDSSSQSWEKSLIYYRIGECYDDLIDFDYAIKYYKLSYKADNEDKETLLKIANSLKRNTQYSESLKYFKKYKNKGENKEEAERQIKAIKTITKWISEPTPHKVVLNKSLSSPYFDYSPFFISPDNTSMIFTSSRAFPDRISQVGLKTNLFYSAKKDNLWSNPIPLDTSINKADNEGVVTMDTKRKVVFFTRCQKKQEDEWVCDIYYSFMDGELIGEPILLNIERPDVKGLAFGHPSFSNELDLLFFASNLPGGYGGKDIWVMKYDRKLDSWSKPHNLGPEINTAEDELFPFIAKDSTLYYSSKGGVTLGGLDIFKASRKGDLMWGNSENMKYPINSAGDDFGIILTSSSNSGYFSSDRKGGLGKDDIYEFELIDNKSVEQKQQEIFPVIENKNLHAITQLFNKEACVINIDSLKLTNFKVFPNPNNGMFALVLKTNQAAPLTFRIHSTLGHLVYSETFQMGVGNFTKNFNINTQSPGIYYLQILYNCKSIYTEKLIIK